MPEAYRPDRSLRGKLRRRLARLVARRPVRGQLQRPLLSITFDDVPESGCERGAALLEARGARGTFFVAAGLCGTEGPMGRYATAAQLRGLLARGHELACHTFSHLDCGAAGAPAIRAELERSAAALAELGAPPPRSFAFPYGDVSATAKQTLAGRFDLLRAVHPGLVERGTDLHQAPAVGLEGPAGATRALRLLDRAAARRAWLIAFTHDVAEEPSPWGCTPAELVRLLDRAAALGVELVTVAQGLQRLAG
jgi:peptidoglycan/xylan/chitin deacetylase (PgdA/CDA1 family)